MINGERGIKITIYLLIVWVLFIGMTAALAVAKIPVPPQLNNADTSILAFIAGAGLLTPGVPVTSSGSSQTTTTTTKTSGTSGGGL